MIKVKKRKILLLPGDGIGPEVVGEVKKIIEWFNSNKSLDFEIDEFKKKCLIEGLDDIDLSMGKLEQIDSYEKMITSNKPWIFRND